MIEACPKCESSDIEPVQAESFSGAELSRGDNYRCENCKEHFTTPMYREPRGSRNSGRSGITKKLMEADPNDWP